MPLVISISAIIELVVACFHTWRASSWYPHSVCFFFSSCRHTHLEHGSHYPSQTSGYLNSLKHIRICIFAHKNLCGKCLAVWSDNKSDISSLALAARFVCTSFLQSQKGEVKIHHGQRFEYALMHDRLCSLSNWHAHGGHFLVLRKRACIC